jgi:hypothetical protein
MKEAPMSNYLLPDYVTLPELTIESSGDFRKDFSTLLRAFQTHFETEAKIQACASEFGPSRDKKYKMTGVSPKNSAVAASVIRRLLERIEATPATC